MPNRFYQEFDFTRLDSSRPLPDDHRSPFQIDRDRVIFSYAFRRLQSKTQVFQTGEYDFYRTRLTHSIEVARIGRSICDYLRTSDKHLTDDFYIDPDLTEAVGLAHDLGHPPFGHIGERELNALMAPYGGFEGNAQTLRILTELIYERKEQPCGMNPTRAFLDGVLKYKLLFGQQRAHLPERAFPEKYFLFDDQAQYLDFVLGKNKIPTELAGNAALNDFKSIECQIMDWADDTAYSLHDILDGIRAGFLTPEKIEVWSSEKTSLSASAQAHLKELIETYKKGNIEARFSNKIGSFIQACKLKQNENFMSPLTHRYAYSLEIDETIKEECQLYKQLAFELIFESVEIKQFEFKRSYMLKKLFNAIKEHYIEPSSRSLKILPVQVTEWVENEGTDLGRVRRICDYIAGLTDGQATHTYKRLFDPEFGSILDLL